MIDKKSIHRLMILLILSLSLSQARPRPETDNRNELGAMDLKNRAYTTLDINKLGQYVSNIGQFYSSWNEVSPTAEWPLGSKHEQMYRMNIYIGVPGNVVQTRTSGTKEWDPVAGYHNPNAGALPISNKPETWPLDGQGNAYWPVQDSDGNHLIISQQDSYAVFRDATNYKGLRNPNDYLNIQVHQTSYAWNTALDEDYIVFRHKLVNMGDKTLDSLYYSMYTDFDAGGFESGNEYADDKLGFDRERQFVYFYDSDNYSDQWSGLPFHVGIVMLETPEIDGARKGITDFHYTDNYSEPSVISYDTAQYNYISSSPVLRADSAKWPLLFHGEDLHYDDPSLIPDTGAILVSFTSSGPYTLAPGDSLVFIVALVAGQDYNEISENVDRIWEVYRGNWRVKSVPVPTIVGSVTNNQCLLNWSNQLDREYLDVLSNRNTLQGYYVYRTEDPNRVLWTKIDSVARQYSEADAYQENAYTWTDHSVLNSFYYSYSVTAYDSLGDESGKSLLKDSLNTVELRPASDAMTDLSQIQVVPNPYLISAKWERARLGGISDGEPIRELSFRNLPSVCAIKIYTVDGDLVRTIHHNNGTGIEYWDIRSEYNQMVSTGIYFYHVSSSQGDKVGKFAIIR